MRRAPRLRTAAVLAIAMFTIVACSGTETPTASGPDDQEDPATTNTEPEGDPATAGAQLPDEILDRGHVIYCATLDNPPRAFLDDQSGELTGFEVELGEELADRLGVEVEWLQLDFDGLIAALQAEQCDAIVQELFIRPEREEIIDFIRVTNSAQSLVVQSGNEAEISSLDDLSGKSVAVPNGTTIHTLLEERNEELRAAGEEPISIAVLPTTPETLQQLAAGQVDAVGTTHSAAAYYITLDDQFEFAGEPFETIANGIGFRKGDTDLYEPFSQAFDALVEDGTYHELLEKWNLQSVALY